MREIQFRGKRLDNGEWVYGYYGKLTDGHIEKHYIMTNTLTFNPNKSIYFTDYEVDPKMVGQFTGLHDKNGVEMYEGDIYHQGDKNILYVVVWHDTSFIGKQLKSSSYAGLTYWLDRIEVIGNIYDNPELIHDQKAEVEG